MLILGEIRTCLLRNSTGVRQTVVGELLRLISGEQVWMSERPIAHAVSPEVVRGVDCPLPTRSGTRVRGVGTIAARAVISAGRVLQGSVTARVEPAPADRRLPWSHYLSRPGVVEAIGKADLDDLAHGFVMESSTPAVLDLGSVSERLIGKVQTSQHLDHVVPFRSARTKMRWAALGDNRPSARRCQFTVVGDTSRTIFLTVPEDELSAAVRFCEDVALHDWVLTTVLRIVERGDLGSGSGPDILARLRPAVDHLMHVWMPGAHVPDSMLPFWRALERRSGFTRQWETTVTRIRDQLAMRVLTAFYEAEPVPRR
jgi:hypothetical protein